MLVMYTYLAASEPTGIDKGDEPCSSCLFNKTADKNLLTLRKAWLGSSAAIEEQSSSVIKQMRANVLLLKLLHLLTAIKLLDPALETTIINLAEAIATSNQSAWNGHSFEAPLSIEESQEAQQLTCVAVQLALTCSRQMLKSSSNRLSTAWSCWIVELLNDMLANQSANMLEAVAQEAVASGVLSTVCCVLQA